MQSGAVTKLKSYYISLGLGVDKSDMSSVHKDFRAFVSDMQRYTQTAVKGTMFESGFFKKWIPGANIMKTFSDRARGMQDMFKRINMTQQLAKLDPKNPEIQKALSGFGFIAKRLSSVGAESALLSRGLTAATGIWGAVAVVVYKVTSAILGAREEMKKFDRIFAGVGSSTLIELNTKLSDTAFEMSKMGLSFTEAMDTMASFMRTGLSVSKSMDSNLVRTTLMLGDITGESNEKLADFFSTLQRGSNLSTASIKVLASSWAKYNNSIKDFTELGAVSFAQYEAALKASSTALTIAANKGSATVNAMLKDMVTLTAYSERLGVSTAELAAKFENASNIISTTNDGFRNLLLISGGANLSNVLNNTFDRTDAMIKSTIMLQDLNKRLGGNINLTADIANQTWGLSKDLATKMLATNQTTIAEMRRVAEERRKFNEENSDLQDNWKKFTSTLSEAWGKISNQLTAVFLRGVANGPLQNFVARLSNVANNLIAALGKSDTFDKISNFFIKVSDKLNQFLNWVFEALGGGKLEQWVDDITDSEKIKTKFQSLGEMLGEAIMKGILYSPITIPVGWGKFLWGYVSKFFKDSSAQDAAKAAAQSIKDRTNSLTSALSASLKAIDSKISKYQGAQATDIIYDYNKDTGKAEFMAAGLKMYQLEEDKAEAEKKMLELQQQQTTFLQRIEWHLDPSKAGQKPSNPIAPTISASTAAPRIPSANTPSPLGRVGIGYR